MSAVSMEQLAGVRPFSFERVFPDGDQIPAGSTRNVHLKVAELESEIARLRLEARDHEQEIARARADGFEAGRNEESSRREEDLRRLTHSLLDRISGIDGAITEATERLGGRAADLARTAAEIIAGRALEEDPARTIDEAIGRALKEAARGEELHIHVHPDLARDVERCIEIRQGRDRRRLKLIVVPDAQLHPHDSRINWEQGEIVLSRETREAAVRQEFEKLFSRPE